VEEVVDEDLEEGAGVGVVAVDFVEDDDFSGETVAAELVELDGKDSEQGLVDGADAVVGEQGAA
jgi:hypothetical protein